MAKSKRPDIWARIDKSRDCWKWTGFHVRGGIEPRASIGGKCVDVRKFTYKALVGPLPPRTPVANTCGDPSCVNPGHMAPGMRSAPTAYKARTRDRIMGKTTRDGDCLLYGGYLTPAGYGLVTVSGKTVSAHRAIYSLCNGPIPSGACVMHTCDKPACVNPAHLVLGTQLDNMRDRMIKGRYARAAVKLTFDQVKEIRASTESTASLAKKFDVRNYTVACIRKGITWKNDEPYRKIPLSRKRQWETKYGTVGG